MVGRPQWSEDWYWREDPGGMTCIQAASLRSVGLKEGGARAFIE